MKTLKYTIIIGMMASVSLFNSCDDSSFLNENPDTSYTTDNVFKTSGQVKQVVTSCYEKVKNLYCPSDVMYFSPVHLYKGNNGTDMFDVPTIRYGQRMNDYGILSSQTGVYYNVYSAYYELINIANTALMAADLEHIAWNSQEEKAATVAEARFFRALAYRNLGELYGGVPLVTEMATSPRYDYKRTTRLETYQFAIDELESCLTDLPATSAEAGRLVKAAAQHNLSQLYIDKGVVLAEEGGDATSAYSKAVEYANQVIDGGLYSLMKNRFGTRASENPDYYYATAVLDQTPDHLYSAAGYPIEGNVYWDLFQEGNQDYQSGNKEAIWVAQIDYTVYKQEGGRSCLVHSANYGPIFRDQGGDLVNGSLEDAGGLGCSGVMPTFYTRDEIYADKWSDDMRNSEAVFRRQFLGNVKGTPYYGKLVPWKLFYKEDADGKKNDASTTQLYPISCKIATDKYTGVNEGEDRSRLFRDDYLIRLSETILLRAEAKLRMGNKAGAAADINMLRERAQCKYLVTSADVNIDLILDERARELIYEECRWNTLLRMGGTVAVDRIKKYSYWDAPRVTLTKQFNLWPIPQTVIDTNKDVKLEQNPGW